MRDGETGEAEPGAPSGIVTVSADTVVQRSSRASRHRGRVTTIIESVLEVERATFNNQSDGSLYAEHRKLFALIVGRVEILS
jgi:hypothetical protein